MEIDAHSTFFYLVSSMIIRRLTFVQLNERKSLQPYDCEKAL